MENYNKPSFNIITILVLGFISVIIASQNQPENVGLGGLAIFIFQPIITIITIIVFLIFKNISKLEKHSWVTTLLGVIYSFYFAFFGYWNL